MPNVTNTAQLSLFDTLVAAIRKDSTLAKVFQVKDFYEFEENFKSLKSPKLPHIVIKMPATETDRLVVDATTTLKTFTYPIIMKLDYTARAKARDYCNRLIRAIEQNQADFTNYGTPKIDLDVFPEPEYEDQKQLIVAQFTFEIYGAVSR